MKKRTLRRVWLVAYIMMTWSATAGFSWILASFWTP